MDSWHVYGGTRKELQCHALIKMVSWYENVSDLCSIANVTLICNIPLLLSILWLKTVCCSALCSFLLLSNSSPPPPPPRVKWDMAAHLIGAPIMVYPEEVRHASRNADSACPFLYWRDGKKGHAESAFRDACRTSCVVYLLIFILQYVCSLDCSFKRCIQY